MVSRKETTDQCLLADSRAEELYPDAEDIFNMLFEDRNLEKNLQLLEQ